MAINANLLKRPTDKNLYLAAAVLFPLLVLIGYFKSYYFMAFFSDAQPIANKLVHAHALVMSAWVIYFVTQVALVRTKNIKLHMTMGFAGIALAALVIAVGMLTAYDSLLVRRNAPPGIDPHSFFILPFGDMFLFIIFFAGAVYYRKRPLEHKSLMLMTAINFVPAALFRIPIVPESYQILFAFGTPAIFGIAGLIWLKVKHGRFNYVFAAALLLYILGVPARMFLMETQLWLQLVGSIAPKS
jgi:hypothetical protein